MTKIQVFSAGTIYPNTLETDAIELIPHVVRLTIDGISVPNVIVLAREPGQAIEIVRNLTSEQVASLPEEGFDDSERPSTSKKAEYLIWFLNQIEQIKLHSNKNANL
jgi:hypothetical protein